MSRTSHSDSLSIPSVRSAGGGRIGMVPCPGKQDPYDHRGPMARDLETELDAIRAWGARALVCLMEPHELEELGVPSLLHAARRRGLEVYHLPIRDGGVPDEVFERRWGDAGARLCAHLAAGRDVLVHCRGGIGRTGMIAARLLIEMGMPAEEALQRVRAARPGAVENPEQEAYVLSCRPPGPGDPQG